MRRFAAQIAWDDGAPLRSQPPAVRADGVDVLWRGWCSSRSPVDAVSSSCDAAPDYGALFGAAYRMWGAEFPKHLDGEYAVLIHDRAARRVVAAHDELGVMPLFYAEAGGELHVASHLADVVDACGTGDLDEEFLADHLARGAHYGRRTPYARIRRLAPGEALVHDGRRAAFASTWTLPAVSPARFHDAREYEHRLRELIEEGVAAAMRGCERVWCELSGGLDSSTVFATATRLRPRRIEAFSFVFGDSRTADERRWIEPVLEAFPAPWHRIDSDAVPPFTSLPDEPYAEPSSASFTAARRRAYYALLRDRRVDAVLTGTAGDAVLFGDRPQPYHCADLLLGLRLRELAAELGRWSRAAREPRARTHVLALAALRPALRYLRRAAITEEPEPVPWIAAGFERRVRTRSRYAVPPGPRARSVFATAALERIVRCAHVLSTTYAERDVPCEFRHPLLYRPLVAYMLSVPPDVALHPDCDRLLQRRALEDVLPRPTILRSDKQGPDQWFYAGFARSTGWLERLTASPRLAARGYIDVAAWEREVRRVQAGATVGIRHFFSTASAEVWLQSIGEDAEQPARAAV